MILFLRLLTVRLLIFKFGVYIFSNNHIPSKWNVSQKAFIESCCTASDDQNEHVYLYPSSSTVFGFLKWLRELAAPMCQTTFNLRRWQIYELQSAINLTSYIPNVPLSHNYEMYKWWLWLSFLALWMSLECFCTYMYSHTIHCALK